MLEVLARGDRQKPKALPPDSECKHGTTPQGCPNKDDRKPSWPSRELPHKVVLSTWEGPGPWDLEGSRQGSKPSSQKSLLGPWTSQQALTPATKQEKLLLCHVSHEAPSRGTNHAPGTHPPPFHPAIEEPSSFSFSRPIERAQCCLRLRRCRGVAQGTGIAHDHRPSAQT